MVIPEWVLNTFIGLLVLLAIVLWISVWLVHEELTTGRRGRYEGRRTLTQRVLSATTSMLSQPRHKA